MRSLRFAKCCIAAAVAALTLSLVPACTPPRPEVIAVMRNPATGEQVHMYRENPLKVPAGYDEQKHIAQWKAEQRTRGFTEDASPP